MSFPWPWRRKQRESKPSLELQRAKEQFEAAKADDRRVDQVVRRTARIMKENNLAPDIMKALGVRQ